MHECVVQHAAESTGRPAHSTAGTHPASFAEDCDEDVQEYCWDNVMGSQSDVWGIGAAGRCLSKQLAEGQYMDPQCKMLVLAAAPKVISEVSCYTLQVTLVTLSHNEYATCSRSFIIRN